jgi:hypothetical protein
MGVAIILLIGLAWAANGTDAVRSSLKPQTAIMTAPQYADRSTTPVQGPTCASECQTQHNQCRVQTKGSSSCDAQRQRCLEVCLQKRKR